MWPTGQFSRPEAQIPNCHKWHDPKCVSVCISVRKFFAQCGVFAEITLRTRFSMSAMKKSLPCVCRNNIMEYFQTPLCSQSPILKILSKYQHLPNFSKFPKTIPSLAFTLDRWHFCYSTIFFFFRALLSFFCFPSFIFFSYCSCTSSFGSFCS